MRRLKGFMSAVAITCGSIGLSAAVQAQEFEWVQFIHNEYYATIDEAHALDGELHALWAISNDLYAAGYLQHFSHNGSSSEYLLTAGPYAWGYARPYTLTTDTAVNKQGYYYINKWNDYSPRNLETFELKAVISTSNGSSEWVVKAQSDPEEKFLRVHADESSVYLSSKIENLDGSSWTPYLTEFDLEGNQISKVEDSDYAAFNALAGQLDYTVDYATDEITILAVDGTASQVISVNNDIQGVDYYNGLFYVTETSDALIKGGYQLVQYDLNGNSEHLTTFTPKFSNDDGSRTIVKAAASGIFTLGYQYQGECCDSKITYRIAQYDTHGDLVKAKYLPEIQKAPDISRYSAEKWEILAIEDDAVYVRFLRQRNMLESYPHHYLAKVAWNDEPFQKLPVTNLHYINPQDLDLSPSLGVVGQGLDEFTNVQLVTLPENEHISQPRYSRYETFVDSAVYPQTDSGPGLVFLAQDTTDPQFFNDTHETQVDTIVEVRSAEKWAATFRTQFNRLEQNAQPLHVLVIPDQNGNGYAEIGVVSKLENNQGVFMEVRDPVDNAEEPLYRVSFNPNFTTKDVAVVQDQNNDGLPELALLGVNENTGLSKIEIRGLDGQLIKNLWPGKNYTALSFIEGQLNDDGSREPATELSVVQVKPNDTKGTRVITLDVPTGKAVRYKGLNPHFTPVKAVAMPDINGNGADEYAVLSQSSTEVSGVTQLKARIDIVDAGSNITINKIWLRKNAAVYDVTIVPDQNGNQSAEIATLIWQDGGLKTLIHDSITNELLAANTIDVVYASLIDDDI